MAINIKSSKTINSENGINCLISGKAGYGKTVTGSTAPKPLFISVESGLLSIADKDIDIVECTTLDEIKDVYQFLTESEDSKKYESVVLDSVSEMGEIMLAQYLQGTKDARQAYGDLNTNMVKLIRSFRDMTHKNVVFICKEGVVEDAQTGLITYAPVMPGKRLTNEIPYFFDEVLTMRIKEPEGDKKGYRYLQTQPCMQYQAKDRSGKLKPIEKPDLTELFNKIKSKSKPTVEKM